jgi:hypothetical protein
MKTGILTRLNILIASAVLTLTVGAANALSPGMAPDKISHNIREDIRVELALVFMFLAFVAGYCVRAAISRVHRGMAGRDRHIDWDVASENFSHIPTASALAPPPSYGPSFGKSPKFKNYAH